jgi:signal transduction histidine kinase
MRELTTEREYANRFQLVSRMADDLAHEIKNPLNSMVINLEVLRSRAGKADTEGILGRAAVLESEILRLNGLIDSMLKLLRPDRSAEGPFAVDSLLGEIGAVVSLQAKLARKDLEISNVPEGTYAAGPRDAVRFGLLNVLMAALRSVPTEGVVALRGTSEADVSVIHVSFRSTHADDAGPGIRAREESASLEIAGDLLAKAGAALVVAAPADGEHIITITLPKVRSA